MPLSAMDSFITHASIQAIAHSLDIPKLSSTVSVVRFAWRANFWASCGSEGACLCWGVRSGKVCTIRDSSPQRVLTGSFECLFYSLAFNSNSLRGVMFALSPAV